MDTIKDITNFRDQHGASALLDSIAKNNRPLDLTANAGTARCKHYPASSMPET